MVLSRRTGVQLRHLSIEERMTLLEAENALLKAGENVSSI